MPPKLDIEKEYKILQRKYKLPSFNEIEDDFEISIIKEDLIPKKFILRMVRRKINEKLVFFIRFLEGIIHPQSPSIIAMHESKYLLVEDRDKALEILKELMVYERRALILEVESDDKSDSEYIKEAFKGWADTKKELLRIFSLMKDSWTKAEEIEIKEYFG